MARRTNALAAGVLAALAVAAPAPAARFGEASLRHGPLTVGYSSPAALSAAVRSHPARIVRRLPALRVALVWPNGDAAAFTESVSRLPGIRFVQRVVSRSVSGGCTCPALAVAAGKNLPWEWQFFAAREDLVPDWVLRAAGSITIAVIDTGADVTAPDLAAKAPLTYNQRTGSADVRDTSGHGTFVAALAAASLVNNEGIAGFGGDAHLIVIKTGSGDGSFTDVDEATAITYAVDHGARIINLSFGGSTTSLTEKRAIDYAVSKGALLVAAAGNEYLQGNPVEYPAALLQPLNSRGVGGRGLSIGASTMIGTRAPFSNTGTYVSLAAPGENVFSNVSSTSLPSRFPRVALPGSVAGFYGYASGSSFAAPQVSGAAALVWAANPLLDAATVMQILKDTASGLGAWTPELGYGVLDVGAAVARATGVQTPPATATLKLAAAVKHLSGSAGSSSTRRVSLVASLQPLVPTVPASARTVTLEEFDGFAWRTVAQAPTSTTGVAAWMLTMKLGTYKVRARWAGSSDLRAALSGPLKLTIS